MSEFIILIGCSVVFLLISIYVKTNDKLMVVIYIIMVAVFAATRNLGIPDTQGYVYLYQNYSSDFTSNLSLSYIESGFVLLTTVIKYIVGNNYKMYFFIIALINISLILLGIKMFYKNEQLTMLSTNNDASDKKSVSHKTQFKYLIPLIMYVIMFGYSFNFITIRVGLAFALLFLAYAISNKNKVLALILCAISVTMQSGSVFALMLVPFLFYEKPFSKQIYILWLLMIPILWVMGYNNVFVDAFYKIGTQIPTIYARFHPYLNENSVNSSSAFIRMAVYTLLGIQMITNNKDGIKYNFILKTYLLGLTIFALFFNIAIIGRISEIFIAFAFIAPSYYMAFSKRKMSDVAMLIIYITYFSISTGRLLLNI